MPALKIKPLFRDAIPGGMSEEDFDNLEQQILEDGAIRDALETWNDFIVDGHNRYKIWKKHKDKLPPYDIRVLQFESEKHAKAYILKKALARRNLSAANRKKTLGELALTEEEITGGKGRPPKKGGQNDRLNRAGDRPTQRVADKTGVSEATVRRARDREKRIQKLDKSLQLTIENANKEPGDDQIRALSELTADQQSKVARLVRTQGTLWDDAIKEVAGKTRETIVANSKKKAAASSPPAKEPSPLAAVIKTMTASRKGVGTAIDRVSDEWREPLKKAKTTGVLSRLKEIEKQLNGAYEGMGDLIRLIRNEKEGTS
jgi:hypothetical protein